MSTGPDHRAHLDCTDPGLLEGRCSDCGKVRYSTTTAASCHRAGKWMRSANPNAFSFIDHPEGASVSWDPEELW